jgi:hypothetical protein
MRHTQKMERNHVVNCFTVLGFLPYHAGEHSVTIGLTPSRIARNISEQLRIGVHDYCIVRVLSALVKARGIDLSDTASR